MHLFQILLCTKNNISIQRTIACIVMQTSTLFFFDLVILTKYLAFVLIVVSYNPSVVSCNPNEIIFLYYQYAIILFKLTDPKKQSTSLCPVFKSLDHISNL